MAGDKLDFQVAAPGLLNFLRLKGGVGPNVFGLDVNPDIDVTEFYGNELTAVDELGAGVGALPRTSAITSTQARRYLSLSGVLVLGAAAGTWAQISIGYVLPSGSAITPLLQSQLVMAPVAGQTIRVAIDCRGLVLPPGHRITAIAEGNAGGADHNVAITAGYQRLDGLP